MEFTGRAGHLLHRPGGPLLGDAERGSLEEALRSEGVGHPLWKAAFALYAGLIFWLSSRPLPAGLSPFPFGDKVWHFLEYLLFGLLAWRAFQPGSRRAWAGLLLFSLGYAGSDELHQLFVPTRAASLLDWAVDALGIVSGLFLSPRFWGLHFRPPGV